MLHQAWNRKNKLWKSELLRIYFSIIIFKKFLRGKIKTNKKQWWNNKRMKPFLVLLSEDVWQQQQLESMREIMTEARERWREGNFQNQNAWKQRVRLKWGHQQSQPPSQNHWSVKWMKIKPALRFLYPLQVTLPRDFC